MSQNQSSRIPGLNTSPFNVVLGGAGLGLLLAAAAVAYMRSQKTSGGKISETFASARSAAPLPINFKGKWALNTAIRMIEHDTSRKVLLVILKSMAKRAK